VTGALLVLALVLPFTYSEPSEQGLWLFALWLCWSFTVMWVLVSRSFSPPALGLMAIMFQYVLIPATRAVLTGRTVIAGVDYTSGTLAALQISVAAQLSLTGGLIIVHRSYGGRPQLRRVAVEVSRERLNRAAIATMALAATALALLTVTSGADLSKYIAIGGSSSYGDYFRSSLGTASGYLESLTGVAGACVLVAVVAGASKRPRPILPVVLAVFAAGFLISGGQRVQFVLPVLAAGILWMKVRRGPRSLAMRTVTLLAIGGVLIIGGVVGVARGPNKPPITVAAVADSQFGQGSDLFAPLAGLAQTVPAQADYLRGSSYLDALYFPIPRALWPAKPEGAILGVMAQFSDLSNGESFPEYGEMYANFGVAGVILGCLLFGAVMEGMWIRFAESVDKRGLFVYPVLIAIMLQIFTRAYAVSVVAGVLGFLLGAIALQRALKFGVRPRDHEPSRIPVSVGVVQP
jgi:hypothetical protein